MKACTSAQSRWRTAFPRLITRSVSVAWPVPMPARPARWKLILRLAKRLISIRASVWAAPCAPDSASSTPSKASSSSRTRFSAHARVWPVCGEVPEEGDHHARPPRSAQQAGQGEESAGSCVETRCSGCRKACRSGCTESDDGEQVIRKYRTTKRRSRCIWFLLFLFGNLMRFLVDNLNWDVLLLSKPARIISLSYQKGRCGL